MNDVVLADDLAITLLERVPPAAPRAEWLPTAPVRLVPDSAACPRPAAAPGASGSFAVSTLMALEESGFDPDLLDRFRAACRGRAQPPRRVLERLVRSWLILDMAQSGPARRTP